MPHLLEVKGLHSGYGLIEVLKGVDLFVDEGEIVTVIGANGAGKTTLLMTISGIVKSRNGSILFEDSPIHELPPEKIVEKKIIHVPEGRKIFPRLTVMENLEMGAYLRISNDKSLKKDYDFIFSTFPVLKERISQLGGTLSGGEQQMLAIGRALMAQPRILIMDEPSLGLAPVIVSKIFEVIRNLNKQGVTILLIEQNARMALKHATRGYVLETGSMAFSGPGNQLLNDERVKMAYLGM